MNDPVTTAARSAQIHRSHLTFTNTLRAAQRFLALEQHRLAALCAQIAAHYACANHPGIFVSPALERLLVDLGTAPDLQERSPAIRRGRDGSVRRVLHVATQVFGVGGHSRLIWRWIVQDAGRIHSVALTHQEDAPVPPQLERAARDSGGDLCRLDGTADLLLRARTLRRLAQSADVVVLHAHSRDVIPIVAFAAKRETPPLILLNKSDHAFWLGVGIADVVAHMRDTGARLAWSRRGVERARSTLIPIPVVPVDRRLDRARAKQAFGLPASARLLLTVATAYKYAPVGDLTYLGLFRPLFQQHAEWHLIAIGPQATGDWLAAERETGGRIRAVGPQEDTDTYFEAADLYVDSLAFTSPTSLLEAGLHGVPLVSLRPYGESAEVLCAPGAPGLSDVVVASSAAEYRRTLEQLLGDEARRAELGDRTRRRILQTHTGAPWLAGVEETYALAMRIPPAEANQPDPPPRDDELDRALDRLLSTEGAAANLDAILRYYLQGLSLAERWRILTALRCSPRMLASGLLRP